MSLTVRVKERQIGTFVIYPAGSLDSNTYGILEDRVDMLLKSSPKIVVFDLEQLDYISSAGLRVMLKVQKHMKNTGGKMMVVNSKPSIQKVFDIVAALPSQRVFTSVKELDDYLDAMQHKEE